MARKKLKITYLSYRPSGPRYVRDFPTKLLRAIPNHPKQFSRELELSSGCLLYTSDAADE